MRKSDGQLAAWVHIAKQHVRRCSSAFLPEIPSFQNCRHVLGDVVDGKRPPIDQQHDRGSPGFDYCFDQIILRAEQFERIAFAAMLLRPSLAVAAFVLADHENCDIGGLCSGGSLFYLFRLGCWINQLHVVVEPTMPVLMLVGESAAFPVPNLGLTSDPILNFFETSSALSGETALSASMKA